MPLRPALATRFVITATLVATGIVTQLDSAAATKVVQCDVGIPIPGDDQFPAAKLSANIAYPDDPATGRKWPTVITVTPYGKDLGAAPGSCSDPDSGAMALTKQGFVVMVIDQRGAGKSTGQADNEGGSVAHDGYHVLSWIQKQPWSDGKVGQFGCSALGMSGLYYLKADQQRVRDGLPRAMYALWADSPPGGDQYRSVSYGPAGAGSDSIAIAAPALIVAGTAQNTDPTDPDTPGNLVDQPLSQRNYLNYVTDFHSDGPSAFIEDDYWTNPNGFWRQRAADPDLRDAPVPVMLSAGYYDLVSISNGALTTWMNLVASPQRVVMIAPHGHCGVETGIERIGQGDRTSMVAKWFAHYLQGVDNGIDRMPKVNFFGENGNELWTSDTFPLPHTQYTPYYLNGSSTLTLAPPTTAGSASFLQLPANHGSDEEALQPNSAHFTSAPATKTQRLAGLITADLYATITNPNAPSGMTDGLLTAQLYLIRADGTRVTLTPGWMRAGNRAIDPKRSLYAGRMIVKPWHPNSKAAYEPVPSGSTQRYQIEVNPLGLKLNPGDRIQLAITAHDSQILLSTAQQAKSSGGLVDILYGPETPSRVIFPMLTDKSVRITP